MVLFVDSVTLVGPTASGKTAAALKIARMNRSVDIVSVDSMTVYREMNVGTAKPTALETEGISYNLLDVASVTEEFSLWDFLSLCKELDSNLHARGKRPLLVGGTALYLKAVLDDFTPPKRSLGMRSWLEQRLIDDKDSSRLHHLLSQLDPAGAQKIEVNNARRIVRALEVALATGRRFSSFGPGMDEISHTDRRIVGIKPPREVMRRRISERVFDQMDHGWLEEAEGLYQNRSSMSKTALQALGYKELFEHLAGAISLEEATERIIHRTWRFAKRQLAWFDRDPRIVWSENGDEAVELITEILLAARN
ncbi:MAG: tRNA (adenosine(37)-N6)-dimethylallyltransferase MiaA [Acidimicrobiaceae bacterium]|nr:tRNA (adenosine(37)-N6)-dimethylallyltransferase MiaA [Acidimicrobiaceae bacterium]